jgi:hypothetical protein
MSSGERTIKYNTDEQILSDDLNRQQRFRGSDAAEVWRHLVNAPDVFSEALGSWHNFESFPSDIEASVLDPGKGIRADVFEGLLVIPQAGTNSLFVTPGLVGFHDPDGQAGSSNPQDPNPADSSYKLVYENAGIKQLEQLKVLPNAGPGIRIDIVECQRVELVEEQDNRNIFDINIAGFVPVLVDKVTVSRLNYRVRQGVPSAGMPDLAQGWLPLAVISLPDPSENTEEMTFWDVRPVIRDRALRPYRGGNGQYTKLRTDMFYANNVTNPGVSVPVAGTIRGESLQGYTAGGTLFKGTPTATMGNGDVAYIDVLDVENQEPGFLPLAANQIYYLWACFPKWLPRWVRYTETISGAQRLPNGPKGIPVVSKTAPLSGFHNFPTAPIVMPLSTGLVDSASEAVCLAALPSSGAALPASARSDGEMTLFFDAAGSVLPTSTTAVKDDYKLVEGTHFPPNARAVKVILQATFTGAPAGDVYLDEQLNMLHNGTSSIIGIDRHSSHYDLDLGGNAVVIRTHVISRIPPAAGNPGPDIEFSIDWNPTGAAVVKSAEQLRVVGWKLAD